MLSLAAMFAVLSYASPASAELKLSGDASVRERGQFNNSESAAHVKNNNDNDLKTQYRIRLKASADLGSGYFFKAMIQNEEVAGGWQTVASNNVEKNQLEVSNFYFGRVLAESHYQIGRLPLNSFNNPIFDLALYPIPTKFDNSGVYAVDVPVATFNFDRIFGMNYGAKVGDGDLNATLVLLDNNSANKPPVTNSGLPAPADGLLNDGYALHLSYKTTVGDVTLEPQAVILLTDGQGATYQNVSSNTFGANATIPSGKSKIGLSGFYTVCQDHLGSRIVSSDPPVVNTATPTNVDYNGYLFRVKGESGPVMAWVDYNRTNDNSVIGKAAIYNNVFVWAQYNVKVHESATGTFSLTPTVRYRTSKKEEIGTPGAATNNQLRGELYATVTF